MVFLAGCYWCISEESDFLECSRFTYIHIWYTGKAQALHTTRTGSMQYTKLVPESINKHTYSSQSSGWEVGQKPWGKGCFKAAFTRSKCRGTSQVIRWVTLEAGGKITKSSLTRFRFNPWNNKEARPDNQRLGLTQKWPWVGQLNVQTADNSGLFHLGSYVCSLWSLLWYISILLSQRIHLQQQTTKSEKTDNMSS